MVTPGHDELNVAGRSLAMPSRIAVLAADR